MSTPIFHDKKPVTEEDIGRRMQAMIDLQNEEIKQSQHEAKSVDKFCQETTALMLKSPPETTAAPPVTNMSRAPGTQSLHNMHRQDAAATTTETKDSLLPQKMGSNVSAGDRSSSGSSDIFGSDKDQGVGQGTLYINSEKMGSSAGATGSIPSYFHSSSYDDPSQYLTSEERRLMTSWPGEISEIATGGGITSYGAINANTNETTSTSGPPPPSPPPPQQNAQQLQEQERQLQYLPHNPNQNQHQFHYGNPDYPHHVGDMANKGRHSHLPRRGLIGSLVIAARVFCSCLSNLFYICCYCCSTYPIEQQQLHRSFCYGAIDGMLTGSGIVAGFCGLDLLAPTSITAVRTFVVAFSAAACFADSLCMALGHVWTTYVLVSTTARERAEQRLAMESNKADAKGKLVDMLLDRGMLKIDAMSLTDTLEGYPDIFISALVGDALIAGGVNDASSSSAEMMASRQRNFSGGGGGGGGGAYAAQWNMEEEYARYAMEGGGGNGGFSNWGFPSYSQKMHELENEVEPEAAFVSTAMTESRREGLFMMLGFSIFAVVPSLIYLVIPMLIKVDNHIKKHSSAGDSSDVIRPAGGISATSIVISIAAVIMWCLGVWKSQFLDSNWMLFGIETVIVLLVCIGAAYGSGALLAHLMPQINASSLFYFEADNGAVDGQ